MKGTEDLKTIFIGYSIQVATRRDKFFSNKIYRDLSSTTREV